MIIKQINFNEANFKISVLTIKKQKIILIKNAKYSYYCIVNKKNIYKIKSNNFYFKQENQIFNQLAKIKNILLYGIKKKLVILGLGYQAYYKNEMLNFKIGFSHTIILKVLSKQITLSIFKCRKKNINIKIISYDYEKVYNLANKIKLLKKPNIYKEIGIFNKNEKKKIKAFKKK